MAITREVFIFALLICLGEMTTISPITQGDSNLGNVSAVLAKCEAIAMKTAEILIQQSEELASNLNDRIQPAITYLSAWGVRVVAQGIPQAEVDACMSGRHSPLRSVSVEKLKSLMDNHTRKHMIRFDEEIFDILYNARSPTSLEKSVKILQDFSGLVVETAKIEAATELKDISREVKGLYEKISSCLRGLMLNALMSKKR